MLLIVGSLSKDDHCTGPFSRALLLFYISSFSLPCPVWLCLVSLHLLKGWFGINCNAMLLFFFSCCNPDSVAIGLQHQNVEKLSAIEEHGASAIHSWPLTVSTSSFVNAQCHPFLAAAHMGCHFKWMETTQQSPLFRSCGVIILFGCCQIFWSLELPKHTFFSHKSIITTKWLNLPHLKSVDTCL